MTQALSPVCITVAPNGARRGKADHLALPLTPAEIAAEAQACCCAGAAVLHLHVREADGAHSLDPGRYREAIAAVSEVCDLIVQPTTERVGRFQPDDMMQVQRALRPESITLNLEELLDGKTDDEAGAVREFLHEVAEAGTVPQYIVYSPDQLQALQRWHAHGWLPQSRPWVLAVLGRYGGGGSRPLDLLPFLALLPSSWLWGVCAFGSNELACVTYAALAGGHPRVGFENNLLTAAGEPLRDNADQVARLKGVLQEQGIVSLEPESARKLLGLRPGGILEV